MVVCKERKITEYRYRLIQPFRFELDKTKHTVLIVSLGYNISRKVVYQLSRATVT